MAGKTYLIRGYFPGVGIRYWYSSSATDLFFDYPSGVDYPTPTSSYQDVVIFDIVNSSSGTSASDGYSMIDSTHVAGFSGTIKAGEPLVLTQTGLVKAYANTHNKVFGLAAATLSVTSQVSIIPVITLGLCVTANLGSWSASFNAGDELYLTAYNSDNVSITNNITTLSTTEGINIIKIGTWVGSNKINVLPSFVIYTG